MEAGLHEAPLLRVMLAFAGEQAFAEQNFGALEGAAFGEVPLIGDQNVADEVGVVEQIRVLRAETEIG